MRQSIFTYLMLLVATSVVGDSALPSLETQAEEGSPRLDGLVPETSHQLLFQRDVDALTAITNDLTRLRQQVTPTASEVADDPDMSELANRIASSRQFAQNLATYTREHHDNFHFERLSLPAKKLTQRECRLAALLYQKLFDLVRDERRVFYGSKAVEYLRQYVELADVKARLWAKLEEGGIPCGTARKLPPALLGSSSTADIFEYYSGYYCAHLWLIGGHLHTSILVDREVHLQFATIEEAAKLLANVFPNCDTPRQVEDYLREVLRVLPCEATVISSARDIPLPDISKASRQEAANWEAEWQKFRDGVGKTIAAPSRNYNPHCEEYTIYVYERLGGAVNRYRLRFLGGKYFAIEVEEVARWIGDYRAIM